MPILQLNSPSTPEPSVTFACPSPSYSPISALFLFPNPTLETPSRHPSLYACPNRRGWVRNLHTHCWDQCLTVASPRYILWPWLGRNLPGLAAGSAAQSHLPQLLQVQLRDLSLASKRSCSCNGYIVYSSTRFRLGINTPPTTSTTMLPRRILLN